jgi:hypothetical protein
MPVILATWKVEITRIVSGGQPWQIVQDTPMSKITRAKWTGGVAQAVEHLLCKQKALSLNPQKKKCDSNIKQRNHWGGTSESRDDERRG